MRSSEPYRQFIPHLGLSLESNTESVPRDGFFYVVRNGDIVGRFKTLKQALAEYRSIRDSLLPKDDRFHDVSATAHIDAYLLDKELYWAEAHRFRHRGGKGGRGGV